MAVSEDEHPLTIAFLLFPGVTQLDLTGPAQILSRIGAERMDLVWKTLDPVPTDAGFAIVPTATFETIDRATILCVPGGMGVTDVIGDDATMAWVARVGGGADWVTSVCTGSLILGAAGLLAGYRATTHWAWHEQLALFGVEPVRERVVIDRNRVTGGGVTAGIEFALALTARILGERTAHLLQLAFEYDPQPPFDAGSPAAAGEELVAAYLARADRLAPGRTEALAAAARARGFGAR